jgi:uncharacterized protein
VKPPSEKGWRDLLAALDERGYAVWPGLLDRAECRELTAIYDDDAAFRSRVVMARHNYGSGEYKYLHYPLPPLVAELRNALYPALAPLANQWHERLRLEPRFPATLEAYLARCHAAGQQRPTPLILKYEAGDYNRLHQDLYGEFVFPIQATILLSAPEQDFTGGEFLFVEQRARMQSRGEVVPLGQGDAVVFAVNHRPLAGARGFSRARMRHGVSPVRSGRRFTLGVIFHDAA